MDDDEPANETRYERPASAKMSKTPSWIMLGFILGAAFVAALPPWRTARIPPPEVISIPALELAKPVAPRDPPELTTIEELFAEEQRRAVWFDDTTEIAAWNIQEKAFSNLYEVRRVGGAYYFRTIPKLSRRVISHGKPVPGSPLQFTETEEQYQEWREHGRAERPTSGDLRPPAPFNPPAPSPVGVSAPVLSPPATERVAPNIEVPLTTPGVVK